MSSIYDYKPSFMETPEEPLARTAIARLQRAGVAQPTIRMETVKSPVVKLPVVFGGMDQRDFFHLIRGNDADINRQPALNFVDGDNTTVTVTEDDANNELEIKVDASVVEGSVGSADEIWIHLEVTEFQHIGALDNTDEHKEYDMGVVDALSELTGFDPTTGILYIRGYTKSVDIRGHVMKLHGDNDMQFQVLPDGPSQGDMLYFDATAVAWVLLLAASTGALLTFNSSNVPAWLEGVDGDITYFDMASATWQLLAKPTNSGILKNDSNGIPAWIEGANQGDMLYYHAADGWKLIPAPTGTPARDPVLRCDKTTKIPYWQTPEVC